jgi:predicted DCC family thiol-disulfide oxidoreductase YuxK
MPVRFGVGAVLGDGKQWVSWIHIDDLVRLFEFALDTPACKGAMNAVSPAAATHAQMQRLLAKVLHRPLWLRIPALFIRVMLGEMSQLLVDGQRVAPMRALRLGFAFKYPNLGTALEQLLGRARPVTQQAEIYYNGDCPVCRTEMEHYAEVCATTRPGLRFIDSTRLQEEFSHCGLRREHLERRVYVRDGEGRILSGMPAIIALWLKMPGYERLARIFSLPVIRPTTVVLYDHVIAPTLAWWARTRSRRRTVAAH